MVLWSYRTTPKRATGESPFCLTYGEEALIPVKMILESHRVQKYDPEENDKLMLENLDMVEERREIARARASQHKRRITHAYNQRVKTRTFQVLNSENFRESSDENFP